MKRQLRNEMYLPSFSSRNVFCESKFRHEDFLGPSFKIIDGTETPVHAFPWMVSLQYDGEHFCGGSLINEDTVLTAAHCMNLPNFQSNYCQVFLGEHDLSLTNETEFTLQRRVSRIVLHHGYSDATSPLTHDIAILKLDQSVPFSPAIGPVCLPTDSSASFEPRLGISIGWGITENGTLSDVLQQVEINIISSEVCQQIIGPLGVQVSPVMMCTLGGPNGGESTCNGDSGGPLMVRQDNKFILVGLVSFGEVDCTAPLPSVYARVAPFLDWIAVALST
ncbi:chymotrypsin B-like [Tigriopus californicus]|uniref:chymotrypsin B-like n=1 Tax=Tigriopus californicus TaxID=6832 RepID=UPI0027DA12B9|nr:chymotrypsin B-like [Tigriopus californicus]